MKKSLRNLLIFLGIAVLIFVVYFVFFRGNAAAPSQSTSALSSANRTSATTPLAASGTATTGNTLLSLLGRVSTLTLNEDIFSNPAFTTLRDISIVLPAVETRGRANPFSASGAATSSTASTTIPPTTGTNTQ